MTVKLRVVNRGTGRARATVTRLSLGAGRSFADGDLVLATVGQPAIPGGRSARPVTARLRIPLDGRAAGRRTLLACADATAKVAERSERDNCAVAGTITFPEVKAGDVVAADRAAGRIDDEQAWALGVLTRAGSPEALPARYRGATVSDRPGEATAMIMGAAARMANLKPKTQRLLAPLFLPPTARIVPAPAAGKAAVARAARKAKPKPKAARRRRPLDAAGHRPRYDPGAPTAACPGWTRSSTRSAAGRASPPGPPRWCSGTRPATRRAPGPPRRSRPPWTARSGRRSPP